MSFFKNKLFLSLLSGILLYLSWYPNGFVFLIFFAFLPLFFISDILLKTGKKLTFWQGIWCSFPAFLIWNVGVTWWIWNSTPPGSIAAMVLNSLFMSCIFATWHWVKKSNLPTITIPLTFVAFWCSWEFLHLNWQINWPWLNLGNVFAATPKLVQWYEYTGTFGGTIWILCVNFLFYRLFQHRDAECTEKYRGSVILCAFCISVLKNKTLISLILTIITPILISFVITKTYKINQETPLVAVVVQQNIDAWTEQYEKTNFELAELLIETASTKLTSNTALLVCPESSLSHTIREDQLNNLKIFPSASFQLFDSLFQLYPDLNIVLGLSTAVLFDAKISSATRDYGDGNFVEFYNTSCLYNKDTLVLYRKCRLVPGVEKMPYPKFFWFLENLAVDLGGINGSLGFDSEQRVFPVTTTRGTVKIGAPICYESIFGELFSKFVRNGAQLMCVITNDAWWGNTPGYKQHFEMSRLRAIETRRYILRAANTGISAFIDPLGNTYQKTDYGICTAIAQSVFLNDKITFYSKNGDYLARIMVGFSALIISASVFFSAQRRRGYKVLQIKEPHF